MKRVYVNEEWCLACHLCEYNCAFANSGLNDMVLALKGKPIYPRIHVEGSEKISYAVSCRHCEDPICVKSCIAGALSKHDGVIRIDKNRCVGCFTCILVCPFGALAPSESGVMQKCELCLENA
ncbi:MAG: 4Fe-4S binding protein, partial [Oscillospiraceae bacterium]|nr:4Fe-4S binding protein [Oscillospiraceae bacterium]